jgi:hypothetical protein
VAPAEAVWPGVFFPNNPSCSLTQIYLFLIFWMCPMRFLFGSLSFVFLSCAQISGDEIGDGTNGPALVGECGVDIRCADSFPFQDDGDTREMPLGSLNRYSCAPNTNEAGPEVVYKVTVPSAGFLSAVVYSASGADIDVHILKDLTTESCLSRGDKQAKADVEPGEYYIVADSYVTSSGKVKSGGYSIDIGFVEPSVGPCEMQVGTMPRVGDNGNVLAMPAVGPIVMEAHLVTEAEPAPYPSSSRDQLSDHYALSQALNGFVMLRQQAWAPLEGGSFYGAGIGDPKDFPAEHEAWYVNMMWRSSARPAKGTRMILRDPNGGSRAVVVAAGYETGPGNLANIAGTTEETHYYMGTQHLSRMKLGIATDQSLPVGPRVCTD